MAPELITHVELTYVNATKGYSYGSEEIEIGPLTRGEVYRRMRAEYGRCTSRVYVDKNDGPPVAVGWVFVARAKYDDSAERYLRETWVTCLTAPTETRRVQHLAEVQL